MKSLAATRALGHALQRGADRARGVEPALGGGLAGRALEMAVADPARMPVLHDASVLQGPTNPMPMYQMLGYSPLGTDILA